MALHNLAFPEYGRTGDVILFERSLITMRYRIELKVSLDIRNYIVETLLLESTLFATSNSLDNTKAKINVVQ